MRNAKYAIYEGDTHCLDMSESHNGECQADTNSQAETHTGTSMSLTWKYNWDHPPIMDNLISRTAQESAVFYSRICGRNEGHCLQMHGRGNRLILLAPDQNFQNPEHASMPTSQHRITHCPLHLSIENMCLKYTNEQYQ